jgi:hypothetical protein
VHEIPRQRTHLGVVEEPCAICGQIGLDVIESRRVRRGRDRLNPAWDPAVRTYRRCPACHVRHDVEANA